MDILKISNFIYKAVPTGLNFNEANIELPLDVQTLRGELLEIKDTQNLFAFLIRESVSGRLKSLNTTNFYLKGFEFKTILNAFAPDIIKNLAQVNKLGIKCAPTLIGYIEIGSSDGVLITYYPGAEDEPLLAYSNSKIPVLPEAKKQFINDMRTLLKNNLFHDFPRRGIAELYITASSEIIYLKDWSYMVKANIEPQQKLAKINSIRKSLDYYLC